MRQQKKYGVEKTFLVNHLAPFLLTNLLLDHLQEHARIVNVSSRSHLSGQLDFNDLNFDKFYFGTTAYGRSKLANVLVTYELVRRLDDKKITVNALHPGRIGTDIFKADLGSLGPLVKWLVSRVSLTPELGADNTIFLPPPPHWKASPANTMSNVMRCHLPRFLMMKAWQNAYGKSVKS
jgi:NAD(P)-dependent dehydrogenase (short-subunit alcohol dehydrogenase family)